MTKKRIGGLLALLVVLSIVLFQAHKVYARDAREFSIPKSYGTLKGVGGSAFVFEDSEGTIRIVNMNGVEVQAVYRRE
jgi:hypothetical protein